MIGDRHCPAEFGGKEIAPLLLPPHEMVAECLDQTNERPGAGWRKLPGPWTTHNAAGEDSARIVCRRVKEGMAARLGERGSPKNRRTAAQTAKVRPYRLRVAKIGGNAPQGCRLRHWHPHPINAGRLLWRAP